MLFFLSIPAHGQNPAIPESRTQINLSFSPVVKKVAPAVVNIYAKRIVQDRVGASPFFEDPFFQRFFGHNNPFGGLTRRRIEQSLGSGVIIEPDGLVITNAHVIKGAEDITIMLRDGRQFGGEIVLVDEPTDLAVIKIDEDVENLPHVDLKPSDTLEIGDLVVAIGNPFGVGQTVTSGIVSALARSSLNINDFNFFIQTDAAINPGNSGGPLVAMDGGVIGINTAIYSKSGGSLGIGFAVPSEIVGGVISAYKAGKTSQGGIIRPWLGVTAQPLTADLAKSLGLKSALGALISELHPASPFLKSGIKAGDVIISVNGNKIRSPAELKFRMTLVPIGQSAELVYSRQGDKQKAKVKTIAPPDKPPRNQKLLKGNHPFSGASVANLNPALVTELGIKNLNASGVVVLSVATSSSADRYGLERGLIVNRINDDVVLSVKDMIEALDKGPSPGGWAIEVEHKGQKHRLLLR